MRRKKIAEHPVFYYGSNEPTLTSQFEWSVNTFKVPKQENFVAEVSTESSPYTEHAVTNF
jgi:hypothetical protein